MILVHSSIAGNFVTKFAKAVNELKAGMPWDKSAAITPLPNMEKVSQMNEYVEDAIKHGAKVINTGGGVSQGTLYYPAVLYPAKIGMRVYREEQFGPVVPIAAYTDIDEAMDYIISSDHGQQVSIFGEDADQVSRLIDTLVNQVCRVNINSQCQRGPDVFPFTGRKDSAEGTLSVHDALRAFSIRTMVAAKKNEGNEKLLNQIVKGQKSNFLNTNFIL
jgi:glyceraldehyde-3-phosphate dehydrogenase (NADP+)